MKFKFAVLILGVFASQLALAQDVPNRVTLLSNVRIFDSKSDQLTEPMNVLVRGNKIEKISAQPIATDRRADTVLIDGGGRTLMPGMIDNHWHAMLVRPTPAQMMEWDAGYANLVAGDEAKETLL